MIVPLFTASRLPGASPATGGRKKLVKSWIDETGFSPQKPNWFKRLISNVRIWFHNHGIKIKHLSDDDIANIILRSAKAARDQRRTASRDGDGVRFLAEPFTENQKKRILEMSSRTGVDVMYKILYGGSITRNGNTVFFDGKNSHAMKLHLDAEGFKPSKGPVTPEEVEEYLPLALAQTPYVETKNNRRGKKQRNKIYKITENGIRYTLVTASRGEFRSFYSNKKVNKRRKFAQQRASATGMLTNDNISQNPENASSTDKNGPSAAPDGAMDKSDYSDKSDKSDKSDGNGALFSLESSGSEELKLQVEAMRSLVGHWLDQNGAEAR